MHWLCCQYWFEQMLWLSQQICTISLPLRSMFGAPVMRLESPAAAIPSLRVRHMWFFMLARVASNLNHARPGTMRSTSRRYGFGGQSIDTHEKYVHGYGGISKINHLIPIVWILQFPTMVRGTSWIIVCICPCRCFFTDVRAKIPREEPGWVQDE